MAELAYLNSGGGAKGATDGDKRRERKSEESKLMLNGYIVVISNPGDCCPTYP